ncbi:hypothetical protein ACFS2C_06670 [Prauserella oleivorans]|uniref:Uncharacterized protein n=1 Tax=Prauserella oleivorans TaxID=1478153 RepID=A0ABW5W772_9PSEU
MYETVFPTCGHPLSPTNVYRRPNGARVCRKCRNAASTRAHARRRARDAAELEALRLRVAELEAELERHRRAT